MNENDLKNILSRTFKENNPDMKLHKKNEKVISIEDLKEKFKRSKQYNKYGIEFWYARDLQNLLEYSKWENFLKVVQKSKNTCDKNIDIKQHWLPNIRKSISGKGREEEIQDYKLTRYACYLIAMNGDSKKQAIQFAQNYFAIQTRKQELQEQNTQVEERIEARDKLRETDKKLIGIVYDRGLNNKEIGIMKSEGDKALFGKHTKNLKEDLNIPNNKPLADFIDTVFIKAKDLTGAVTSHNVIKNDLNGVYPITSEHITNNKEVKGFLKDRGIDSKKDVKILVI